MPTTFLASKLRFDATGKLAPKFKLTDGCADKKRRRKKKREEDDRWTAPWLRDGDAAADDTESDADAERRRRRRRRSSASKRHHMLGSSQSAPILGTVGGAAQRRFGEPRQQRRRKRPLTRIERAERLCAKIDGLAGVATPPCSDDEDVSESASSPLQHPLRLSVGLGSVEVKTTMFTLGGSNKAGGGKGWRKLEPLSELAAAPVLLQPLRPRRAPHQRRRTLSMKIAARSRAAQRRDSKVTGQYSALDLLELKAVHDAAVPLMQPEQLLSAFESCDRDLAENVVGVLACGGGTATAEVAFNTALRGSPAIHDDSGSAARTLLACFLVGSDDETLGHVTAAVEAVAASQVVGDDEWALLGTRLHQLAVAQAKAAKQKVAPATTRELAELIALPLMPTNGGDDGFLAVAARRLLRAAGGNDAAAKDDGVAAEANKARRESSKAAQPRGKRKVSMATARSRQRREAAMLAADKAAAAAAEEAAVPRKNSAMRFVVGPSHVMSKKEILELKRQFMKLDADANGSVDMLEMLKSMEAEAAAKGHKRGGGSAASAGGTTAVALFDKSAALFESIDRNFSGSISFEEMLRHHAPFASAADVRRMVAFAEAKVDNLPSQRRALSAPEEAEVRALFALYDGDGSGTVSVAELFEVLNHKEGEGYDPNRSYIDLAFTAEELQRLCTRYDVDHNNELDVDEFLEMMADLPVAVLHARV